jgi:hypothetical protein
VELTARPDPVVLDHLGDVMYRQGDKAGAAEQWRRAMTRLSEMPGAAAAREDLRTLKLALQKKTRQLESGRPVSVSPVVEEPAEPESAEAGAAQDDDEEASRVATPARKGG